MANVTAYKELDEVRATSDIPEAEVRAGDRGVVVNVFERPRPAVRVEFADGHGRTKALVTYSPDLSQIFGVVPEIIERTDPSAD
jgi:hypothetical protein